MIEGVIEGVIEDGGAVLELRVAWSIIDGGYYHRTL